MSVSGKITRAMRLNLGCWYTNRQSKLTIVMGSRMITTSELPIMPWSAEAAFRCAMRLPVLVSLKKLEESPIRWLKRRARRSLIARIETQFIR